MAKEISAVVAPRQPTELYRTCWTRGGSDALEALAGFNRERRRIMRERIQRRAARFRDGRRDRLPRSAATILAPS